MKLYYHPLSTYSQKVLLALYEKNLAPEREVVQMFDPDVKAKYRELYPIGKIPLLMLDDGYQIPESSIIIEYLDGKVPEPRLIPDEREAARRVRFLDRMCDFYVNNQVVALVFESWKPEAEQNAETIAQAEYYTGVSFAELDRMLDGKQWLTGERFSMADCALIPPLFYAQKARPFAQHENLAAYFERARQRPSCVKLLKEVLPALEAMESSRAA